MPCLVLAGILLKVNKYQFLFSVKYAVKFVWWKHMLNTHIGKLFFLLKCQITQKTRLICIFWLFEDLFMMMENVLMKFEGTVRCLGFTAKFELLKVTPDSVLGAGPCAHHFEGSFCPEDTLEITYSWSVPLN